MAIDDRRYVQDRSDVESINTFATQVYSWMAIGLALTAVIAWFVYASGLHTTLIRYTLVLALGTFGVTMAISTRMNKLSFSGLASLFLVYSALEGLLFGSILPGYAQAFGGQLIWTAFGTAALIFSLAVAYGMFSKSDMTSLGRILSMAVMGLVAVTVLYMVLSFFMPVTKMMLVISYFGLIIFVGLTAYDAQQIRKISEQVDGYSVMSCKLSLIMALRMYINVIMIFWYLLQILSSSSKR